jgi:hypothetical protein
MLAAYAAGEQIIGRQIIEEVADNLDLLPRRTDSLSTAGENRLETTSAARVLTDQAREELWTNQAKAEQARPVFKTEKPVASGNSNPNHLTFDDADDVSLEIGGFY